MRFSNALLPFLTSFGIMAGYLFGGSVVVEQVFAVPGLGRLMLGAIAERNYPLVQASILLATLAVRAGQCRGRPFVSRPPIPRIRHE